MTKSGRESNSDASIRSVESILARPSWVVRVPPAYADGLEVRRLQSFARLVSPGTPVVIGLAFAIAVTGPFLYGIEPLSHDGRLWWGVEAITLAIVIAGAALVRLPPMLARYANLVVVATSIILGSKLFLTVALDDPGLADFEIYVCMLITNLATLAFRLPLGHAVLACLGAAIVTTTGVLVADVPIDPRGLPVYGIGSAFVSLGIAFFAERQERLNYLQSVLLARESTERAELNERLERIARTDPLTGVANRRHFDECLRIEWERARREGSVVSLLFVDVDFFKAFNDTYGHPAGDSCLSRIAAAIESVPRRPSDLVARYGGEEFVVLLPSTDSSGAERIATRIADAVDALAIPTLPHRFPGHVTVSIGLASMRATECVDVTEITKSADDALYRAKRSGRHAICASDDRLDSRLAV